MSNAPHKPVMLAEAIEYLKPEPGKGYLDCTFGAGGYSGAVLGLGSSVTAIDRDPSVRPYADELYKKYGERFSFILTNFSEASRVLSDRTFDGIVLDLGVSSMQLDKADRGFSFMHDGPLDMRMSSSGMSAEDFINEAEEQKLADVIYKYGEEPLSRRIAKAIIAERKVQPIRNTQRLAEIVRAASGFKRGKIDQATKTFQAIRIYINQELRALEDFLGSVAGMLVAGGRLVVVSFHSLEDSIVKNFLRNNAPKQIARSKYKPASYEELGGKDFKILTKKPIFPSEEEVLGNPRARSARLRAAEKMEINYAG